MYGYSYLEAGKNVMTLFQHKGESEKLESNLLYKPKLIALRSIYFVRSTRIQGWTVIINDDLVSNVLSLFVLIVGGLTGCVGLALNEIYPVWFQGYGGNPMAIAFG